MKKIIITFLVLSFSLFAQEAGKTGLAFLKNGFGARNIAMGDFGVATANGLSSSYYNPALLKLNNSQISFTHNSLFQDMSSEMLGASFSAFGLPIAIGLNTTSISGIEVRTKPGEAEGTFNASYFSGSISTALELLKNFSVGLTHKYVYENLYTDEATGYAWDFGFVYYVSNKLTLAGSMKNYGSMSQFRNEETHLPSDMRIGAAYNFSTSNFDFVLTGGVLQFLNEQKSHAHLGGEAVYNNMVSLRAGYITDYDSKNITTGFGIFWKSFQLDYAFVPYKYGLGDSHIISLSYSFE